MMTNSSAHGFQSRVKPVTAVSPVARVYRSISMFRKYWVNTPSSVSHTSVRPT